MKEKNLSQTLQFKAPVFIGDEVTANVEIIDIYKRKPILTIYIYHHERNQVVIEGQAVALVG